MRQFILPDGRVRLIYDYRGPSGPNHVKATLPAGTSIADTIKAKAELVAKAERRSLKNQVALFEHMVDTVVKQNNAAGMKWTYNRVKEELAGPIDTTFMARYNRYIDKLQDEKKSSNTIANHKSVIQRVLKTAWKRHEIDSMPVRDFGIKRNFRSRVLDGDERRRLENEMQKCKSYMYWSIRLAERRPIRGLSDLWNLTRSNLVLFGEGAPYIQFTAQKTSKSIANTIIPLADLPDVVEYLQGALPSDCPYLFPRLVGDFESVFDFSGMRRARWYHIGNPKHHFKALLVAAKIDNFHFHDLKRMSTTDMIDGGFTAEELIDLGMYASRRMIDLCYKKRNAMTVLRRLSVGPSVGPGVRNAANL
jgi:integrase